ncbi:MAG TPA: TVP38/TMEM64 family protein [Alphaproteobacteria bacterium]|nr:TVP38/TMEM64 family protein [Alphaproteobacteria bacterium]
MPARRPHPVALVFAALLIVLIGGALAFALFAWATGGHDFSEDALSVAALEQVIESWGMWAVLAAILLMVLHSFVPFPAEALAVANGMLWGPVWGTVITWTGAMFGAWAAFGLARLAGRPLVDRLLAERQRARLDAWTARQGAAALLTARFIPVIAFNLINYAAGLSAVSWWTFTWTTALGILPLTAAMVVFGDRLHALPLWAWAALGLGGLAAWALYLLRRRGR